MRFAAALTAGAVVAVATLFPGVALAAEAHELPGETMSLWWALPFAGLLLSIATGPLLFHRVWEQDQRFGFHGRPTVLTHLQSIHQADPHDLSSHREAQTAQAGRCR